MILYAKLFGIRRLGVKHEFEIIVAIRNSHIYPTEHFPGRTAPPELLEAKNISIEFRCRLQRADRHTHMRYACRNASVGHEFSLFTYRPTIGLVLNDFHSV